MPSKPETRGRKRLPLDKKKPPQATLKINDLILPFVQTLKVDLKKGLVTEQTIEQLSFVLRGTTKQLNKDEPDPVPAQTIAAATTSLRRDYDLIDRLIIKSDIAFGLFLNNT